MKRVKPAAVGALLVAIAANAQEPSGPSPLFSPSERERVMAYWARPERYSQSAPVDARTKGLWQVRLTTDGSTWLWSYNRARGYSKIPPTLDGVATNPQEAVWETWISKRVAYDRWLAAEACRKANETVIGKPIPEASEAPENPGPIPADLLALAGNPPPFASAVVPMRHTVVFEDATFGYTDNVMMRPRFAYYRFANGVQDGGTAVRSMPAAELDALFERAKINDSIRRVFAAVSLLEGGFDSINTYDTGYLSVGFIQFATLKAGGGSLGAVLLDQKTLDPASFESDFRRFGVDVTPGGLIAVIDPTTGAELIGAEAVLKVIADKRLTAVFHRAGARSVPFRVSQLRVARSLYYPADDTITVTVGDRTLQARASEIIRTEAGMATLMDRKVNTGTLDPLPSVLANVVVDYGLTDLVEAGRYEAQIIQAMKYRKDYLADNSLSQPRDSGSAASRGGDPKRGGAGSNKPKR